MLSVGDGGVKVAEMPLQGTHHVRVIRPAWHDAHKWFPRTRDRAEVRSHALKLRYWPEKNPETDAGLLLDVDWCWIKELAGLDIGELRITNTIGGHDNIRVVFYRGDQAVRRPLPVIWVLSAMQKKSMGWTTANLKTFKARRTLVIERFYKYK